MGLIKDLIRSERLRGKLLVPQIGMMSHASVGNITVSIGIGGIGGIQQVRMLVSLSQKTELLSAIATSTAAITVLHFVLARKFNRTPWIVS